MAISWCSGWGRPITELGSGPAFAPSDEPPPTAASLAWLWIAHMGMECVKEVVSSLFDCRASSSSRPRELSDGARRSSQGRSVRTAAKRLDLELSEHAIRLSRFGRKWLLHSFSTAIQGSSRFWQSGLLARSNSHSVVARGELYQYSACGGQAREDEAILRCGFLSQAIHRFVHPDRPGLIGPAADWFLAQAATAEARRSSSLPPRSRRRPSRTSTRRRAACAPAPR